MSSDNFDGPDWSAGGREAYDNADNRLREGRGGSGRGQQGGGNSRQQRANQQGGYSQQPGRYNGPRGGDGRQGGSQQDPYGGRQGGQDRQGARGYSGGRGYQGGSRPQDGRGGYGSGQQGGGPQSAGRGRGDSADATRAQPGGRGGFGPGGSTGRHGSGRRGGSGADNEQGGNGWDPSRGGRHGGRQDNGSGGYRDEIRRGLDRVTGGFQAATGRLSGSFRSVGEQLSGPLRAVGERIPRRGGQDSYGGQGGYGAQNPQGGYGGPADPLATRVGSMSDPYPTRAEPGGPGFPGGRGPGGYGGPGGPGGRGPGGPGRPPGGPRARRKGDWWRHWTWKKAAAVVGSSFAVFVLLLVGAYFYLSSSVAIPDALASGITDQTSTVYYSDGKTPIGYFSAENRTDLTYGQIPQNLQNAVLAAEERSYWTDGAISPTGILRAAYDDLTSSGGSLSGGSTITQEFVRQYYDYSSIGTQQTASRKIKEIFVAMKLSKAESKQWVLTNYLNTIYLGDDSYGVQAAAQTYFGEPVSKLTIAQDAVIAAIIQQPANYPSKQYRSSLVSRWHYVLSGLVKMNDLSQAQANAMKFPTLLTDSPNFSIAQQFGIANPHDVWAPYVMNVVANELEDSANGYTESKLETGGYKIVTSISKPMEQEIYKAVNSNVQQMAAQGGPLPAYALIGAELQNPSNGQIIAMYPGIGQVGVSAKKCAQKDCRLNTAIYAREQVGSSFKPYVLSEAVLQGMNVKTSILDGYGPKSWIPPDSMGSTFSVNNKNQAQPNWYPVTNDGNVNYGPMSVQNAFAQSSNVAFTDLIHKVGTQNVINLAQQFGVNTGAYSSGGSGLQDDHGEVGIALGIAAISVNEQDTMLATIDNGGTYHESHLIVSVTAPGQNPVLGKYDVHEVMNPAQAAQVQWAMSTVVTNGTAAGNVNLANSREVIAKTGTTDNAQSAFFIGAIPQYALTVGIWTENQSNTTTQTLNGLGGSSAGGFGGAWPASIWNTFANAEFTQLPVQNFTQPVFTGAKWVQVKPPPKKKAKPKPSNTPSCQSGNPSCSGGGKGGKGPGGGGPTAPVTTQPTTQPPTCKPGHQSCSTPSPTGTPTGGNPSSTPSTGPVGLSVSAEPAAVQSGLAVGGVVSVVPGSLLWTMASRRRRRRAREKERKAA